MRAVFAIGLGLIATGAEAQVRGPVVPPARTLGVLVSSGTGSRPLGGVALPTFPGPGGNRRGVHQATAPRYVVPIFYVPNAFDTSYQSSAAPEPPAAEPQRITINQYFVSPSASTSREENYPPVAAEQPVSPGDPIGPTQNYYLIAYKDHTVYAALAYWVEGETLHYVTTQNTHNQASLTLLDLVRTTKLNEDRTVSFTLPGR